MSDDSASETRQATRDAWRAAHVSPLWESPTAHKPDMGPMPAHVWTWETLRPLIVGATEVQSPAAVERRVLSLVNPARRGPLDEATVGSLAVAIQILLPGESARPHRHSMNALRFMLEGSGAETIVDGKPCAMEVGDLILTPGWSWHEHVHRGAHGGHGPAIWLDVLDVPLHQFLGTTAFQPGPVNDMPETVPEAAFAGPNLVPQGIETASPHSPVFRYPWAAAAAAVAETPVGADGARKVRYANPLTGGSAMTLVDSYLVQVDRSAPTRPVRTNCNAVFLVVEGEGASTVGDSDLAWGPRDIFIVPQGNAVSHRSDTGCSRLFQVTDREVYARLGLLETAVDGAAV